MRCLHIDFETRSQVDLPQCGAYVYATDPSTKILCMAYAFDDKPVLLWKAWKGHPFPDDVLEHLKAGQPGSIIAHNAQFERLIISEVLFPMLNLPFDPPPIEAYWCTATQARLCGLPGKLEQVSRALRMGVLKDHRGRRLIRECCIPPFNDDPKLLEELGEYCEQDVEVERELASLLRSPTEYERRLYAVSERINDRGVAVDREVATLCSEYARKIRNATDREILRLTDNAADKARGARLRDWVLRQIKDIPEARDCMVVEKTKRTAEGRETVKVITLDSTARDALLALPEGYLPPRVREVIEVAETGSRSSAAKFDRMLARAPAWDPRARGCYLPFGAAQTGRFSSVGIQVHNLPRKTVPRDVFHAALRSMRSGRSLQQLETDTCMKAHDLLAGMLRLTLISDYGVLVGADWSAVEARGAPWLSQGDYMSHEARASSERLLRAFAEGQDVYVQQAAAIYDVDEQAVTPEQRFVGKIAVLSLGYLGGAGALLGMAANYGVQMDREEAERIVAGWREANPWAREFGQALLRAAVMAVRRPGEVFDAGRVQYYYQPEVLGRGVLWCLLPSGRLIAYPDADVEVEDGPYGERPVLRYLKAGVQPRSGEPWPRWGAWPGLLIENVTQATCASLLMDALIELDEQGVEVVLHTHDEIVAECEQDEAEQVREAVEAAMTREREWNRGFPLAVESWIDERYAK